MTPEGEFDRGVMSAAMESGGIEKVPKKRQLSDDSDASDSDASRKKLCAASFREDVYLIEDTELLENYGARIHPDRV